MGGVLSIYSCIVFNTLFFTDNTISSKWEKIDYNYIHTFLFVYVFFKYAIMKNFSLRSIEGILAFLLVVIFCLSYRHTGYMEVLDTVLLILGAKEVRYESILKIYILVKTPLIILTIVGSQIGILQNLVYNQEGRVREAFGLCIQQICCSDFLCICCVDFFATIKNFFF